MHYLSGPIGVEGAEPGDLLVVDILDVGVLPDTQWGFTAIFAKETAAAFSPSTIQRRESRLGHFSGIYANSRHMPGVEFAGIMHPGLIGCLPSKELLETWNKREKALFDTDPSACRRSRRRRRRDRAHWGAPRATQGEDRAPRARAPCRRASTAATATSRTSRAARPSISRST